MSRLKEQKLNQTIWIENEIRKFYYHLFLNNITINFELRQTSKVEHVPKVNK